MKKKPKFCEFCGRELGMEVIKNGFSLTTGKPRAKKAVVCPLYKEGGLAGYCESEGDGEWTRNEENSSHTYKFIS